MTVLMDSLMQYQKKLNEKTVKEYTEDLYRSIRNIILEEVKLLDRQKVKKHIEDNLCLTKNVTFDLGINSDEDDFNDERDDPNHKKNTIIEKIRKEFSNAFIPTGDIFYKLAFHNYNKFDDDPFELLNNSEFIKNIQSILEIECMPITFNLSEYCDNSYRSSFYPYLCFHTDKINIEKELESSDSNENHPFLIRLKEYKEKYDEHKKNEEEAKKIKEQKETKKDTTDLKKEFSEWILENKKAIFRNIKRTIIKSKIDNLEDYKHQVKYFYSSKFDDLEKERQLEELKKNINIENIEIIRSYMYFHFIFTPSEIHFLENELEITLEEIIEKKTKIEEDKEETRQDILKWATDSKEDIIKMFFHFLKLRKYYSEKKEKVKDYISTDILSVKKYSKFWKEERDEIIDFSRYKGILTQELKDKINEILGVTGFDFKTKYDFCNCGLPWGINREDCSIYFEDIDKRCDLKHDETCEYTSNFNYICRDDDYQLYVFFPKMFLN